MSDMDFDAWLEGASPLESSVDVYPDGRIFGQFQAWRREYDRLIAVADEAPQERSAGEVDPVAECEERGRALLEEMERSRTTIFVRGLDSKDQEAVNAEFPDPAPLDLERPAPPSLSLPDKPSDKQAEAFLARLKVAREIQEAWLEEHGHEIEAHRIAAEKVARQRGVEKIRRAFVRMEQGGKVIADSLTAEGVEKLADRIGEVQLSEVIQAVHYASTARPDVPGDSDFLSRRSGSGQDS